jgi:hypothetical protein
MNAPQWRLEILAGVKSLLKELGFRGSHTRFWKTNGGRRLSVQLSGGSDQHDTQKLSMRVMIGIDFLDLLDTEKPSSAYLSLWWGHLSWTNSQGIREIDWRAYTCEEAREVLADIKSELPRAIAKIESRFQTWHDVLVYVDKRARDKLDPPGRVNEYLLP